MADADTTNLGFLLAKASARWNALLHEGFLAQGYPEVRPSYGSVLLPLFETDPLRIGEIARRSRLSKQTMTTMVRLCERDGLVWRQRDPDDARAVRVSLTARARSFRGAAERVLSDLDEQATAALGARRRDTLTKALKGVMDL